MTAHTSRRLKARSGSAWLKRYYFARFAFSAIWVGVAFTAAASAPALSAVMLVGYPAWDAAANFADGQHDGGLWRNKTQLLNVVVSAITTIAVPIALGASTNSVIVVFGIWAGFSGILQLATAVRRWSAHGAQWPMILSGAQSALAGVFFVKMGSGDAALSITTIAPYAAFGAFYFLVSAIGLVVSDALNPSMSPAPRGQEQ